MATVVGRGSRGLREAGQRGVLAKGARDGATKAGSVVDLFAGSGGLSLGLELAGFSPVYVNELNRDAMATYLRNRIDRHPSLKQFSSRDIHELTGSADELEGLRRAVLSHYRIRDVDLVVGGPPCQGFSVIGARRSFPVARDAVPSNHLYLEMVKVIRAVRPKAYLFENVRGLTSSRWTSSGESGEVWEDVKSAFLNLEGYDSIPHFFQARDYGVPQLRPRVFIVGVRRDVARLESGRFAGGLLPTPRGRPPDPDDLLGDLVDDDYARELVTRQYPRESVTETQDWYRWDPTTGRVRQRGSPVSDQAYSHHSDRIVRKFSHMLANEGEIAQADRTKKYGQRVIPAKWGPGGPRITTTSMPDDFVHFSQPRTLTVREWARMQTFPDWYEFEGFRSTGGRRRAGDPGAGKWEREVPKYTQIGNAVPVVLAHVVGLHFGEMLGVRPSQGVHPLAPWLS